MVSVLALGAIGRGFEPRSGQSKDNKIGICCFPVFLLGAACLAEKQHIPIV